MAHPFRRLMLIAPIAVLLAVFAVLLFFPKADARPNHAANVDYPGFQTLTRDAAAHRTDRLVSLDAFMEMASDPETIILDTRSADAFAQGHIAGAVHLNFSDFTEETLAEAIGDKARRILIYCNNNLADDVAPVMEKRAPLALNIPTFVNLYGYGYENVYELADLTTMDALSDHWVVDAG